MKRRLSSSWTGMTGATIVFLASLAASTVPAATEIAFTETSEGVVIAGAGFEAVFARAAAALTIRRNAEVVLSGWAASGRDGVLAPTDRSAAAGTIGALRTVSRHDGAVVLEYDTTFKNSSARLEVRPLKDGMRVLTRLSNWDDGGIPLDHGFAWSLDSAGLWHGGGFQGWTAEQTWPLNRASIVQSNFLVSGFSQATPLWYATKGVALIVRTPLDFGFAVNRPDKGGARDGLLSIAMPRTSAFEYDVVVQPDMRRVLQSCLREIGRPRRMPPAEFFRQPIYTTWVEFKEKIDQAGIIEYARAIRANRLPAGFIEIDGGWETHFGDFEFDPKKFPDPHAMCDELHRLGFRVTIWVHPYVNLDTHTFAEHQTDGLLLRDLGGRVAITRWWEGPTALWDFTEPRAAEFFRRRLDGLMADFGIDGFKFDGADVHLVPLGARPSRALSPAEHPDLYNAETAAHYAFNEARVGIWSQPLGIVQRLIDKNSRWGRDNALAALVPEAIATSQRGFFYLMPDMVGGNQYGGDTITPELLIRWAQTSALMPFLQFSVGPWHHGAEAVRLCREASELHLAFTPYIVRLGEQAMATGEPILASLAYHFPDDPETFAITDQYMIGPDVLVAPVTVKGAVARDVYLPRGRWLDRQTRQVIDGGRWLKAHPAPLDTLPVFIRDGAQVP